MSALSLSGLAIIEGLGPAVPGSNVPAALTPILGRSPFQRHLHHLSRLGIARVLVIPDGTSLEMFRSDLASECDRQQTEVGTALEIEVRQEGSSKAPAIDDAITTESVLVVSGAAVFDPRLYALIAEAPAPACVVDHEPVRIGLARLSRSDFDRLELSGACVLEVGDISAYLPNQRRTLRPYWVRIATAEDQARAAAHLLDATQKGVLDFPARYLHPIPENRMTRWLAPTSVTPNQITVFTGLLGFAATALFARGSFGWGLAIALLVNVLDGVDGKLARVKLLTSRFGDRLDHTLDVTFEFSWYLGLGWGLRGVTGEGWPLAAGFGLIAIMLGCRALSGIYRSLSGRQIHDHTAFDRSVRLVAGRRNIYVLILIGGWAVGHVADSFGLAVAWGAATLAVYAARTLMAAARRWADRRPHRGRGNHT